MSSKAGTESADRQRQRVRRGVGTSGAAPASSRLPTAPRRRRPAVAALAALLVVGGALVAGLLAVRLDERQAALQVSQDVAVGHKLAREDFTEARIAGDVPGLIPASRVGEVVGRFYANVAIGKGQLLDRAMLTRDDPIPAGIDTVGTTPTWLLGDYQGSITDTAGTALTGTAELDPFGAAVTAPTGAMVTNPLCFHGQYQDAKTGLYDVRLRDYDAAQGRFTGPDPAASSLKVGFTQAYAYGYNNPLSYSDPSGACLLCGVVGAIGGAVIGGIAGGVGAYLDSDGDWGKTWEGAGKGAIQGGLAGLGAGLGASGGIAGMMLGAGLGNAAGGYLNSLIWADDYSLGDAGKDFAWGAGTTLAGGLAGKALGRIFAKTKAVQWAEKNIVGHLPSKLRGQYKCPPSEGATARAANPELPNSRPIARSLGAASRAEQLARKLNMNAARAPRRAKY